jgi:hypothetical protein
MRWRCTIDRLFYGRTRDRGRFTAAAQFNRVSFPSARCDNELGNGEVTDDAPNSPVSGIGSASSDCVACWRKCSIDELHVNSDWHHRFHELPAGDNAANSSTAAEELHLNSDWQYRFHELPLRAALT